MPIKLTPLTHEIRRHHKKVTEKLLSPLDIAEIANRHVTPDLNTATFRMRFSKNDLEALVREAVCLAMARHEEIKGDQT